MGARKETKQGISAPSVPTAATSHTSHGKAVRRRGQVLTMMKPACGTSTETEKRQYGSLRLCLRRGKEETKKITMKTRNIGSVPTDYRGVCTTAHRSFFFAQAETQFSLRSAGTATIMEARASSLRRLAALCRSMARTSTKTDKVVRPVGTRGS